MFAKRTNKEAAEMLERVNSQTLLSDERILGVTCRFYNVNGQIRVSVDNNPMLSKTWSNLDQARSDTKQYLLTSY